MRPQPLHHPSHILLLRFEACTGPDMLAEICQRLGCWARAPLEDYAVWGIMAFAQAVARQGGGGASDAGAAAVASICLYPATGCVAAEGGVSWADS